MIVAYVEGEDLDPQSTKKLMLLLLRSLRNHLAIAHEEITAVRGEWNRFKRVVYMVNGGAVSLVGAFQVLQFLASRGIVFF